MKRARTQYETHSSYPGMWTGRWTTSSPNIKEEKTQGGPHPVTELPSHPPAQHPGSPGHNNQSPHITSPYPTTFHDTIVFASQPTTTSSDILYDSINISQAYPTLTSSLGKITTGFPHLHLFKNCCVYSCCRPVGTLVGTFPMLNFSQKVQSNKICLNVLNQVQNTEAWEPFNLSS